MKTAKILCCLALLLSLIFAYGYAANDSRNEVSSADGTTSAETATAPEAPAEMPPGGAANGERSDRQMPQNNTADGTTPEGGMPEGGMPEGGMPGRRMGRGGMGGMPPAENGAPSAESITPPKGMQDMTPPDGQRPGGPMAMEAAASVSNPFLTFVKSNFTPISAVILLAAGFCFVIFYKRKTY